MEASEKFKLPDDANALLKDIYMTLELTPKTTIKLPVDNLAIALCIGLDHPEVVEMTEKKVRAGFWWRYEQEHNVKLSNQELEEHIDHLKETLTERKFLYEVYASSYEMVHWDDEPFYPRKSFDFEKYLSEE